MLLAWSSFLLGISLPVIIASRQNVSSSTMDDDSVVDYYLTAGESGEAGEQRKWQNVARDPAWMHSGKFQGDIDGIDQELLKQLQDPGVQFNALRNRQLIWSNGVIPYELDEAFSLGEVRLLQRAFRTYRRRTLGCIRFRPRRSEFDYLNIVKGNGCYSQVGKTGGKQELSLGRGCLFNETIIHELMHSLGFWHEHSRADRDEHIIIRWENILPGMDSQFDVVSSAIQDTMGEPYDYRSIMHYGSSAFSRNGRNTLEAVVDEYTPVIGTAIDLSELDVLKIMKLYRCRRREHQGRVAFGQWRRRRTRPSQSTPTTENPVEPPTISLPPSFPLEENTEMPPRTSSQQNAAAGAEAPEGMEGGRSLEEQQQNGPSERRRCRDHFLDCPQFREYCKRISFYFIMRSYCPYTCGRCKPKEDEEEVEDKAERNGNKGKKNNNSLVPAIGQL